MKSEGRRIKIPKIEEYSSNYMRFSVINDERFYGRPSRVFKRLLLYGIEQGWFNAKDIYRELIWLGFDKLYVSGITLLIWDMEYTAKDKNWSALDRLRELEEGLYGRTREIPKIVGNRRDKGRKANIQRHNTTAIG